MLKCLSLLTGALLLVPAAAHACAMTVQEKQSLFVSYDRNQNQRIELTEYLSGETNRFGVGKVDSAALQLRFAAMDTRKAGWVSVSDFNPIAPQRCLKEARISY